MKDQISAQDILLLKGVQCFLGHIAALLFLERLESASSAQHSLISLSCQLLSLKSTFAQHQSDGYQFSENGFVSVVILKKGSMFSKSFRFGLIGELKLVKKQACKH